MSFDFSAISSNLVFWVVAILVIIIFFGVIRFFFRHLLHFFFRGCGFILLIGVVIYILHILKVF